VLCLEHPPLGGIKTAHITYNRVFIERRLFGIQAPRDLLRPERPKYIYRAFIQVIGLPTINFRACFAKLNTRAPKLSKIRASFAQSARLIYRHPWEAMSFKAFTVSSASRFRESAERADVGPVDIFNCFYMRLL
jgi:hypothetical protein